MRTSSLNISKKKFIKRKINSASVIIPPSSTTYKSRSHINLQKSQRFSKQYQNKSQIQLNYKSSGFDSMRNSNHFFKYKLISPRNKIKLKNKSISLDIPKFLDNNSIYDSIISKIDKLMENYKKDILKLYYFLSNIENFINAITQEDELAMKFYQSNFFDKSLSSKGKGPVIKYNLESIDESKENKLISPINNNKINISSNNLLEGEQSESEVVIYKKKLNKLIIKINEMENKFKIEKLKYLFCIGEYQKKLDKLEKKLNLDSIEKMPKNELKKILCYPHYVKFDVKEDLNPKSVPIYNKRKNKCHSSMHDNRRNKIISLSKSDSGINIIKDNNMNAFNLINEIKDNDDNKKIDLNDIEEEKIFEKEKINIDEVKNIIELGKINFDSKNLGVDTFLGKNKNYFLSHPKLNYIKSLNDGSKIAAWKLENQINSLPKQLSKLKMLSKSHKNAIVVFPSFLNETIVNLEKLRTNKNFRSIENKFEENFKIKLKN